MLKINDRIRRYIEEHGMTFSFVANNSNIDDSKFSRMMTGKQRIKVEEYEKICKALKKPTSYFFRNNVLETKNEEQEVS